MIINLIVDIFLKKFYMRQAFLEAHRALGTTGKNPNVGCVLIKNNKVIGRARTSPGGRPHAEENLISNLSKKQLKDSTLFVTLEPCAHVGKSGKSCADLISVSGIKEVFVSNLDPDRRTSGKGLKILKDSKINTHSNFLKEEGIDLNIGYFKNFYLKRPFVTLKVAMSLDGKIALNNKKSKWISNKISRSFSHMLRSQSDAIMTSSNTILNDNSLLTCRLNGLENFSPIKIIIDRRLKLNKKLLIFKKSSNKNTIVYFDSSLVNNSTTYPNNVDLVDLKTINKKNENIFKVILNDLSKRKIKNLLIESGPKICTEMLKDGLIDQIAFFRSNKIIGNDGVPFVNHLELKGMSDIIDCKLVELKKFGNDYFELRRL